VTELWLNASEKVGKGLTVNAMLELSLNDAETPWIVTVAEPRVAVEFAASVSVLAPVAGFGVNVAVTPLGRPAAEKVTAPAKPFCPAMVSVAVPLLLCATDREEVEALIVKLGAA
jgi:hypothetical protein